MNTVAADVETGLREVLGPVLGDREIVELKRLSAGANRETWSFDAVAGNSVDRLIMQRAREGATQPGRCSVEADVMRHARSGGVTVPEVLVAGDAPNPLDRDFMIARRLVGESIARRILRDPDLESARRLFVADCARELVAIHTLDPGPMVGRLTEIGDPVDAQRVAYEGFDDPHPVFDLAFRWLAENRLAPVGPRIVHGDFRMGNLLISEGGIAAVLDWELCHIGDPRGDLGWLCARAWRFGEPGAVGGIGSKADLLESYEAAGGFRVGMDELRWWELLATLRWGNACLVLVDDHRRGRSRSVELAMIGRRIAEVEYDALLLLPELVK